MARTNNLRMLAASLATTLLAACVLVFMGSEREAQAAASLINGGFETGNLSGWSVDVAPGGSAGAVTSHGSYVPKEGNYFALLTPGQVGTYTMVSQPFSAQPGDKVNGWAFFK